MSAWSRICWLRSALPIWALACFALTALAADEDFSTLTKHLQADKPKLAQRQQILLVDRHGLADRPVKSFPLRGIKDSPPYLHDGLLLTLANTVEFFSLVLELKLDDQDKKDLLAFILAL